MTADLRDAAAEATRLALAMGSDAPDAVSFVAKLCSKFPLVAPVLETLKSIREKLDDLKAKKEELVALNKRCTGIAAAVVVKCQLASRQSSQMDVGPLEECLEALEVFVERFGRRGKLSTVLNATSDKNEILRLHQRVGSLPGVMGLASILAVFKGVLVSQVETQTLVVENGLRKIVNIQRYIYIHTTIIKCIPCTHVLGTINYTWVGKRSTTFSVLLVVLTIPPTGNIAECFFFAAARE